MALLFDKGVALVTGAGSGIGRATAKAFSDTGCTQLVLGDLSSSGLEETRDLLKKSRPDVRTVIVQMDVTDETSVQHLFNTAQSSFGRVDYVVNCAGYVARHGPITGHDESEFDKSYVVNLRGVFLCQRAALRQMMSQEPLPDTQQRGAIVNIGSISSVIAMPGVSIYSATKAGVLALTKSDAVDYGPHHIRIVCVGRETP